MGAAPSHLAHLLEEHLEGGVGPIVVVGQLVAAGQFSLHFRATQAGAHPHDHRLALETDHPGRQYGILQVGKLLLDHAALLVAQFLGQHLLGGGGGHAAEVVFFRGDIEHNRVAHLGILCHLLHFDQGDLVVFAFDLFDNDLAGKHAIALFIEVEGHIEVAEVILFKGIFADAQIEGAPVAFVALKQGLPQGRLHHLGRQLLLFADVLDQIGQAGEKNQCHWSVARGKGIWEVKGRAPAGGRPSVFRGGDQTDAEHFGAGDADGAPLDVEVQVVVIALQQ